MALDDAKRLSELTTAELKRVAVYAAATLLATVLFVALVRQVFVALLLGVVVGAFLLPVQERLESYLRARAGSALITISLIVVPLAAVAGYGWYEVSFYSKDALARRGEIADATSRALSNRFGVGYEDARQSLEAAIAETVVRSARFVEELQDAAALLLISATIFFFTLFYVLTRREQLAAYIKLRVSGVFLPFYEKLSENVGGALRGALWAVFVDQSIKAALILVLNLIFDVPLAVVLAFAAFLVGFFPMLGVWVVYVPVSLYLLVFQDAPGAAAVYFLAGVAITFGSTLFIRPLLAARQSGAFNFYWMLTALVAGVYAFGVPGVVLGPAILGFAKAVLDTLVGDVRYETSLLKEEMRRQAGETERGSDSYVR